MSTKITRLTGLNILAIERAIREGYMSPEIVVTKTTATFPGDAQLAMTRFRYDLADMAADYGRKRHPVASLRAVDRKLIRAAYA